jgi:hypothetical protein
VEPRIDPDSYYAALAIRTLDNDSGSAETVAWVELLSPSNKGETKDAYTYAAKRQLALERGIVFVEIDYLHETPATFAGIPDYPRREPEAKPYRIVVIDPRPQIKDAIAWVLQWSVDAPLPTVKIPLKDGDILVFDFDSAYQRTFEGALYGYDRELNYRELPMGFDRYTLDDQARIANRMLAVLRAAQNGTDLTAAPLPAEALPLEAALAALAALTAHG